MMKIFGLNIFVISVCITASCANNGTYEYYYSPESDPDVATIDQIHCPDCIKVRWRAGEDEPIYLRSVESNAQKHSAFSSKKIPPGDYGIKVSFTDSENPDMNINLNANINLKAGHSYSLYREPHRESTEAIVRAGAP
jgi:hypothetical protein